MIYMQLIVILYCVRGMEEHGGIPRTDLAVHGACWHAELVLWLQLCRVR